MDVQNSSFVLAATLFVFLGVVGCALKTPSDNTSPAPNAAGSFRLIQLGEAKAWKGTVARSPRRLMVKDREGLVYDPLKSRPLAVDTGADPVASSPDDCTDPAREPEPGSDTVVWESTGGTVGPLVDSSIEILAGTPPGSHPLDVQFAPMQLRIRTDSTVAAKRTLEWEAFPCRVLLVDLTGGPEKEIALVWMSFGGSGYTTGLTVYSVRRTKNRR